MIIGNSLPGVLGGASKSSSYSTQGPSDANDSNKAEQPAAQDAGRPPPADAADRFATPAIRSDDVRPLSFGAEREEAVSMHQTARIMALVASMRQVDDVSAYSLFGKSEGETDEHRHVVTAYRENSE